MERVTVGSGNKGDCQVTVTSAPSFEVQIEAGNKRLVGQGIRAVVEETACALGVETARIAVDDKGALNYVIAARTEAALRAVFSEGAAPICPSVTRAPSPRDHLRWSRLYAPGNNPRLLVGIELHSADCVLLDLEDSVPLVEKGAARILVKHLLATVDFPEEVWVRINPLNTYGQDDLAEVLYGRPHGICLPKTESAEDVRVAVKTMTRIEQEVGIPLGSTWIMPIIETAKGVLHCEGIAVADERVVMLAFGAEDFTRDVGAKRVKESLLFARSMIVASAKAAFVQASDTVFSGLEDEEGLIAETQAARDLGFDGKGAINPRQIALIHTVFSPNEQEVEEARKIVTAAEEAQAKGLDAIVIGGKMIDKPVLERARKTLALAAWIKKGGAR